MPGKIVYVQEVNHIAADFEQTWKKQNQSKAAHLPHSRLYLLDGSRSRDLYEEIFEAIRQARQSIKLLSPYVSKPLLSVLEQLDTHVDVQIITPLSNNKSIMTHLLLNEAKGKSWQIGLYKNGMSHAKALLIDDQKLIIGSSNFDFVSYELEQEIVLATSDSALIKEFIDEVWDQDARHSIWENQRTKRHIGGTLAIFVAQIFIRFLGLIYRLTK